MIRQQSPSSLLHCLGLTLMVLLAGCVGGGGGSSDNTSAGNSGATPQSTPDLPPVVMTSGDTLIRDISREFANGDHLQEMELLSNNEYVTGHYHQGTLTLEAAVVDVPVSSKLRLTLASSGEEIVDFTVSVNPTASAAEVAVEADQLLDQAQDLKTLSEPLGLYTHFLKLAYWGGEITYGDMESLLAEWQPADSGYSTLLSDSLDQLYARKEGYRTGDGTSKEDLQAAIDQVYSAVQSHVGYAERRINTLHDRAMEVLPEKPRFEYNYSTETGQVSAILGSGHSGYWEGDLWVFHPWMNFLDVVVKNLTSSACNLS